MLKIIYIFLLLTTYEKYAELRSNKTTQSVFGQERSLLISRIPVAGKRQHQESNVSLPPALVISGKQGGWEGEKEHVKTKKEI